MTCNEFRDRLDASGSPSKGLSRTDLLAHLRDCAACRQRVEADEQLARQLRMLRDSAPAFPASLDASILQAFRAHVDKESSNIISLRQKPRQLPRLAWPAAMAALLLLGAIVFLGGRKATRSAPAAGNVRATSVTAPKPARPQAEVHSPNKVVAIKVAQHHPRRKGSVPHIEAPAAETVAVTLPPDFRSLVYCDELSCSGPMDVIRMNLPASALGVSSPLRTNNVVAADVVVGADGVARAIRIVY